MALVMTASIDHLAMVNTLVTVDAQYLSPNRSNAAPVANEVQVSKESS